MCWLYNTSVVKKLFLGFGTTPTGQTTTSPYDIKISICSYEHTNTHTNAHRTPTLGLVHALLQRWRIDLKMPILWSIRRLVLYSRQEVKPPQQLASCVCASEIEVIRVYVCMLFCSCAMWGSCAWPERVAVTAMSSPHFYFSGSGALERTFPQQFIVTWAAEGNNCCSYLMCFCASSAFVPFQWKQRRKKQILACGYVCVHVLCNCMCLFLCMQVMCRGMRAPCGWKFTHKSNFICNFFIFKSCKVDKSWYEKHEAEELPRFWSCRTTKTHTV